MRNIVFILALLALPGPAHAGISAAVGAGASTGFYGRPNDLWTEISLRADGGVFGAQVYFGNTRRVDLVELRSGIRRETSNEQAFGAVVGLRRRLGRATVFAGGGVGISHGRHTYPEAHWLVDLDVALAPRVRIFGCVRRGSLYDFDGNVPFRRYFGGLRWDLSGPPPKDASPSTLNSLQAKGLASPKLGVR